VEISAVPTNRFLIRCAVLLLAAVCGLFWFARLADNNATRQTKDSDDTTVSTAETAETESEQVSEAEGQRLRARADRITEAMVAEFPELRIEWRSVPPEENGFFQLLEFARMIDLEEAIAANREIRSLLMDWDAERARSLLEEHADWLAEAWRISALENTSGDIPGGSMGGFVLPISELAIPQNLLILQARLDIDEGRVSDALETLHASRALGRHLLDLEASTSSTDMTPLLAFSLRRDLVHKHLLPLISDDPPFNTLRELISFEDYDAARMTSMLRGEWHASFDTDGHVLLLRMHDDGDLPDLFPTARAIAADFASKIRTLEALGASLNFEIPESVPPQDLSVEGREVVLLSGMTIPSWAGSARHVQTTRDLHLIALDILEAECTGNPPPALLDAANGQGFRYDPESRTLYPPEIPTNDDRPPIAPLVLPDLRGNQ